MPEFRQPPGSGGPANPGWYVDPWGRSAWRWWDGWQWTGWISPPESVGPAVVRQIVVEPTPFSPGPPEAPARERVAGGAPAGIGPFPVEPAPAAGSTVLPARPVAPADRRRLKIELLVVLAIFPLPYVVSALQALVGTLLGKHEGPRIPNIFPAHYGAGFPFVILATLLPLAGAALVLYLLWVNPGDGGSRAIGLDRTQVRGDLALVLIVFLLCNLLPILGGGVLLYNLGVKGTTPAAGHFPAYYDVAYVAMAVVAGVVEEIVVLGYLVRRLEQLGFRPMWVLVIAVAVRGSYHLYYGWGVLPLLAWAAVTVIVYRRYRRLWPFILVHVLWDLVTLLYGTATGVLALLAFLAMILFTAMWYRYLPPRPPTPALPASEPGPWSGR